MTTKPISRRLLVGTYALGVLLGATAYSQYIDHTTPWQKATKIDLDGDGKKEKVEYRATPSFLVEYQKLVDEPRLDYTFRVLDDDQEYRFKIPRAKELQMGILFGLEDSYLKHPFYDSIDDLLFVKDGEPYGVLSGAPRYEFRKIPEETVNF